MVRTGRVPAEERGLDRGDGAETRSAPIDMAVATGVSRGKALRVAGLGVALNIESYLTREEVVKLHGEVS